LSPKTSEKARAKTRRRREKRKDATLSLPFGERAEVECPECGEVFENGIYADPSESPSFGNCPKWDCDVFLKYESDGTESPRETDTTAKQSDLAAFAGGESA